MSDQLTPEQMQARIAELEGKLALPAKPELSGVPENIDAELKSKYGDDLEQLTHDESDTVAVFRRASKQEWRKFMAANHDTAKRVTSLEVLTTDTVVWCTGAKTTDRKDVAVVYDALLSKYPGLAESFGNDVAEMCGLTKGITRKKL